MQEKKSIREEKTIVIDIKLTSWGVLMAAGVVAAATTEALTSGMRQYYLLGTHVWGMEATTACGTGYHMASLWEIADPSNLK